MAQYRLPSLQKYVVHKGEAEEVTYLQPDNQGPADLRLHARSYSPPWDQYILL